MYRHDYAEKMHNIGRKNTLHCKFLLRQDVINNINEKQMFDTNASAFTHMIALMV